MSPEKISKRQERREKMQRQQQRRRLITIGLIALGAALVVLAVVIPQLLPVGEIVTVTPAALPNADGLSLGDPNAAATIDVFEDFQCPACRRFTESTEPLIIQNLVATGKARYVFHHYPFLDGDGVGAVANQIRQPTQRCARTSRINSGRCTVFSLPTGTVKTRARSAIAVYRQWQRALVWIWMPLIVVSTQISMRQRSRQISSWAGTWV